MPRYAKSEDVLDLVEALLKAQLEVVQEIRSMHVAGNTMGYLGRTPTRRLSHTEMAREVLAQAGMPLHIGEITKRIRETFGITITRESLASSILRQVKAGEPFVRTGPNVYGLLGRDL